MCSSHRGVGAYDHKGSKAVVIDVAETVGSLDSLRFHLRGDWLQYSWRTLQGIDLVIGQIRFWPLRTRGSWVRNPAGRATNSRWSSGGCGASATTSWLLSRAIAENRVTFDARLRASLGRSTACALKAQGSPRSWLLSRDSINDLRRRIGSTRLALEQRERMRFALVVGRDEFHRFQQLA